MPMYDDMTISAGACLIVGGGWLDDDWASAYAAGIDSPMTIACDSGISYFYENGRKCPDLFIGDYDSADEEMVSYYMDKEQTLKHPLPVHKDVTDSEEALHVALEAGCDPIVMIGMSGSRIDHTMANITMMVQAARAGRTVYMADPNNRVRAVCADPAKEQTTVILSKGQAYGDYFSLFALGGEVTDLSIKGAEYCLDHAVLTGDSSLGVSNRMIDQDVVITFGSGVLLIVEAKD